MKKQQKKIQRSQPQAPQIERKGKVLYRIVGQFNHISIILNALTMDSKDSRKTKFSGPWAKNPMSQPDPSLVHEIIVRVLGKK